MCFTYYTWITKEAEKHVSWRYIFSSLHVMDRKHEAHWKFPNKWRLFLFFPYIHAGLLHFLTLWVTSDIGNMSAPCFISWHMGYSVTKLAIIPPSQGHQWFFCIHKIKISHGPLQNYTSWSLLCWWLETTINDSGFGNKHLRTWNLTF